MRKSAVFAPTLTSLALDGFESHVYTRFYRGFVDAANRSAFVYAHRQRVALLLGSVRGPVGALVKKLERSLPLLTRRLAKPHGALAVLPPFPRVTTLRLSLPLRDWALLPRLFPQLRALDVATLDSDADCTEMFRTLRACPLLNSLTLSSHQHASLTTLSLTLSFTLHITNPAS
jgi:hypothetical protein